MLHHIEQLSEQDITQKPAWLVKFCETYQSLSADSTFEELALIYHHDVVFIDPMHQVEGLVALTRYFSELYENVPYCQFEITHAFYQNDHAAVYWLMTYQHSKLNGGKPIAVEGHSFLKARGGKVIYHRDYIDLGQMLYQHVPVLGRIISWLKARVNTV
ncbi:nuclear transport factor 2 family protein [Thalassotalea sp. 1_MG-2023]|uniref:nuclear transport factor 2 family protein n=1 Tax=Thalassotalea sp. 1_MG-2023 TaxID=3062680 RepID=UPI0026E28FEA|nr:nuclear transport factor 2 family protein [Thalassotalea sp. 1_MG-2023]MDO6427895.1 nuclear transport factor 2 family protein [Thalassotalea sp. 1_MG-2023]